MPTYVITSDRRGIIHETDDARQASAAYNRACLQARFVALCKLGRPTVAWRDGDGIVLCEYRPGTGEGQDDSA